jgi:uncharacterized protein
MTISVHALAIETYVPALRSLSGVLDKGAEHARAKGIDPATLLKERLAPDMFPLSSQIQLACHHAKDGTARAAGQTPPKIEIKELGFDEHKVLIEDTIGILNGASAQAFAEATSRKIELPLSGGRVFEGNGVQYLQHWSIAQFYFHVVTAYDIFRHNGVPLGKRDYMAGVSGGYVRQGAP